MHNDFICISIFNFIYVQSFEYDWKSCMYESYLDSMDTSSTAQGGGGRFKIGNL